MPIGPASLYHTLYEPEWFLKAVMLRDTSVDFKKPKWTDCIQAAYFWRDPNPVDNVIKIERVWLFQEERLDPDRFNSAPFPSYLPNYRPKTDSIEFF